MNPNDTFLDLLMAAIIAASIMAADEWIMEMAEALIDAI